MNNFSQPKFDKISVVFNKANICTKKGHIFRDKNSESDSDNNVNEIDRLYELPKNTLNLKNVLANKINIGAKFEHKFQTDNSGTEKKCLN